MRTPRADTTALPPVRTTAKPSRRMRSGERPAILSLIHIWVGAVAQDVAEDHVFDALFVVLLLDVERGVPHGAQLHGAFLDVRKLLLGEAARVGDGRVNVVAFLLRKVFYAKRGVQTCLLYTSRCV